MKTKVVQTIPVQAFDAIDRMPPSLHMNSATLLRSIEFVANCYLLDVDPYVLFDCYLLHTKKIKTTVHQMRNYSLKGNFGYLSPDPCRVCGGMNNNQQHQKLGYVVCEEHQTVPPHKIPPLKRNKNPDFLKWPPMSPDGQKLT